MKNFSSLQDALRKLQARNRLVSGGTQYTPDVSLDVAGMARGRESLRKQKMTVPQGPISLKKLMKSHGS